MKQETQKTIQIEIIKRFMDASEFNKFMAQYNNVLHRKGMVAASKQDFKIFGMYKKGSLVSEIAQELNSTHYVIMASINRVAREMALK